MPFAFILVRGHRAWQLYWLSIWWKMFCLTSSLKEAHCVPENHSQNEVIFTKGLHFLGVCGFCLVAFRILHILVSWEHCFRNFFGNYTETSIWATAFIKWYMRPRGVLWTASLFQTSDRVLPFRFYTFLSIICHTNNTR